MNLMIVTVLCSQCKKTEMFVVKLINETLHIFCLIIQIIIQNFLTNYFILKKNFQNPAPDSQTLSISCLFPCFINLLVKSSMFFPLRYLCMSLSVSLINVGHLSFCIWLSPSLFHSISIPFRSFPFFVCIALVWFYVCLPVVLPGQCLQDTNQYVLSELQALETEQKHIDNRAAVVEKRLRKLMETGKKHSYREREKVDFR